MLRHNRMTSSTSCSTISTDTPCSPVVRRRVALEFESFSRVESRGGLVKEEHSRRRGESAAQLDEAGDSERQSCGKPIGDLA